MLWQYSRKETKVLLFATLLVFSGYGLLLAHDLNDVRMWGTDNRAQSIGAYAGVEENQINKLAMQLNAREEALDAREIALRQTAQANNGNTTMLYMVVLMGIGLLGLILMNFYLDSKRRHSLY